MARARHWCFTINNPTEEDQPNFDEWEYMIVGREVGENGTPHLQCYGKTKKQLRLSQMKKMLPRAHLEIMRGTPKEASDYCKKEGDYAEHGTLPEAKHVAGNRGQKRKWDEVWDHAKKGEFEEIDADIRIQHYHNIKRIRQDYQKAPDDLSERCGIWLHGPPRSGKSESARRDYGGPIYDKPCNKWWDGYQGEDIVILDDFDIHHNVLGHHLKRWTDKYSFPAEMKGTTIQIRPKKIIVTSNYTPEEIFTDREMVKAIESRFKIVEHEHDPYYNKQSRL